MGKKIISYNSAWNMDFRDGRIKLRLEDDKIITLKFNNGGDFSAVLMMLQGDDSPNYSVEKNIVYTGTEIPGEV